MDRTTALSLLSDTNPERRLSAARALSRIALQEDRPRIETALSEEDVPWVRSALLRALESLAGYAAVRSVPIPQAAVIDESDIGDELYAQALQETTRQILHEIAPILGAARLHASEEIPEYLSSKTNQHLEKMDSLMSALEQLTRATAPAVYQEFDLVRRIWSLIEAEAEKTIIQIESTGETPFLVRGDPVMTDIILSNALRNAVEASPTSNRTSLRAKVVVTWGETDVDYWVSIIDDGPGLPHGHDHVWEIGSTNKEGHLGMGLALVYQASRSLRGRVTLEEATTGGAKFELRWAKSENYSE